jgi:hypothetical protein
MKVLFDSVLETAKLFGKYDGYSQSLILKEECANIPVGGGLIAEVNKKYNKYYFES